MPCGLYSAVMLLRGDLETTDERGGVYSALLVIALGSYRGYTAPGVGYPHHQQKGKILDGAHCLQRFERLRHVPQQRAK